MENINLGGTIRLLRKKKGITQEALANAIGVTSQAVSKWEMNASYPDMALIPVLAGYFEVSMDTLFGYDMAEVKRKIQSIIDDAREILDSLPGDITMKYDAMSFRLKGRDKMDAAVWARCGHLQSLYQACLAEGDCWLSCIGTDLYPDYDKTAEALRCYNRGEAVLTAFILDEYEGEDRYLWAGMQTFHWIFRQRRAACYKKMGRIPDCEAEIAEAYRIISTSWSDFEENRGEYMKYFNQYLEEWDLGEYVK
ncbi:MAG: helix-turn-helix transcriptional regulator [Clostridia bacterium]|nr:helix-turn-helix transcriptional regulator [Clostridia bacterium]